MLHTPATWPAGGAESVVNGKETARILLLFKVEILIADKSIS